eukprot:CAMPEP_0172300668 /NCGR_PEP_ID=MMETSP1058-20130122/2695_1 /TAXON_ID=83371 /ORGANISM="Detonula confervacea, Strain CCMP 353" /LENGTH=401 /DNA_ID=CAMNT_0013010505 /DNA_START=78 /DNA_END=1283 /DNA_ORIENTATION=+
MIAHKIQEYDDTATTSNNMPFDEVFDQATMRDSDAAKSTARLVSAPCDEEQYQADVPHVIPSCPIEESITGKLSDIENKYYIDSRVLGTGHHGSVRECIDRGTGQRFAVKSICKIDPAVRVGCLAREIMLLREMKHCSIVQLVDVFEDAEYVHLVTDLCKGGELFDKIVEKASTDNGASCFAEDEAARIMYQILKAVSYMHKKGIAHRDIKPENILFETEDEDSPIKIIDFGLSRKHRGRIGEPPMSTVVGTPYYIAPEVLQKKYDKSCDLWSVGVIAYIILCGYPPFNGASHEKTHKAVIRGRYCFPAEDWKDVSREAMDFIYQMLQMDPRKRMTVEQALNHPWILKHACKDVMPEEDWQEKTSVEVLYNESPRKRSVIRGGDSPSSSPRRKVRRSMFSL